MCLGWLLTGSPIIGLKIGGLELFTKMILYYFHERAWYKFGLGIPKRELFKKLKKNGNGNGKKLNKLKQ